MLFKLAESLRSRPELALELTYRPNPTLRRIGAAWHYSEAQTAAGTPVEQIVRVESDAVLERVLAAADGGATIEMLTEALSAVDDAHDVSAEEIHEYLMELVQTQVLVSELLPAITGEPALEELIRQLEPLREAGAAVSVLKRVADRLRSIDSEGLGVQPAVYRDLTALAGDHLPIRADMMYVFHADLVKPVIETVLDESVFGEIAKGVRILACTMDRPELPELQTFRDNFTARYDHAWVPLSDVLDDEIGIGFGVSAARAQAYREHADARDSREADFRRLLVQGLIDCGRNSTNEIKLDLQQLPAVVNAFEAWPNSFSVLAVLASSSAAALQSGDFRIYLHAGGGPSGATLLGRFCHADPDLERWVRRHLQDDERSAPDAVFAEVNFVPGGRLGNVLNRPVLRDYEITTHGRSGAPPERQIPVTDLLVSVDEQQRILLYSRRLAKRVIPRLTTAHGFINPALPALYRFFMYLQHQGTGMPGFGFLWGELDALESLPRVTCGRLVLALARWRLRPNAIARLARTKGYDRFDAAQAMRTSRRLPRWTILVDGDKTLYVDFDNPLSVEAFIHALPRSGDAILTEMFPPPDELCTFGPEGRFTHEVIVPCILTEGSELPAPLNAVPRPAENRPIPVLYKVKDRTFPPSSQWLYAKLYGGTSSLDEFAATILPEFARQMGRDGRVRRWFFLRYADPHYHLRIRFHGASEGVDAGVLQQLRRNCADLLDCCAVWRIEVGTYQREIERYGGLAGVDSAEDLFSADSSAVVGILEALAGADRSDRLLRRRIGYLGVDMLLTDLGYHANDKFELMKQLNGHRRSTALQTPHIKQGLAAEFRRERPFLEDILAHRRSGSFPLDRVLPFLEKRSGAVRDVKSSLLFLESTQQLTVGMHRLAASFAHLYLNRLFREDLQQEEPRVYDLLLEVYRSRLARIAREPVSVS